MPIGIYPRKSLAERFWAKVIKTDSCWLWQGCINSKTHYGTIEVDGKPELIHNVSYKLAGKVIPEGMELDHLCRNRACVNPDHLEPVIHRENVLRGINACASNARVTHCPKGHPYDLFNTYRIPSGGRGCRTCRTEENRKYRLGRLLA